MGSESLPDKTKQGGAMADESGEREAETDQPGDTLVATVLDEYETFSGRKIDRERYTALKQAILTDVVPIAEADRSFFLLGSYGDAEEERLQLIADRLESVGEPFLLKDLDAFDSLLLWTTQFKVMANRSTHLVGVYEHSAGGHEWEAGWLDHEPYREKFTIFKRDYPDQDERDEPFDGMFAHFLETMGALDRLYRFEARDDASNRTVEQRLASCVTVFKTDLLEDSRGRNST